MSSLPSQKVLFLVQPEAFNVTCQGQFPGKASTPPITRDIGDLPHGKGAEVGGGGVGGRGPVVIRCVP